jgi:hypothetical protein
MTSHTIKLSNPHKVPVQLYSDIFHLSDEVWRTNGSVRVLNPGEVFEIQVDIEEGLVPVLYPFYFNKTRNLMITAVDKSFQETSFPRNNGINFI